MTIILGLFDYLRSRYLSIIRNLHFTANDLATILNHVQIDINS